MKNNKRRELLYLWINYDKTNCFEKIGFNFNPLYNITFDHHKNVLNIKDNVNAFNVFNRDNINNLTAIIGNNGVGKTTLMNRIFSIQNYSINEIFKINKPEYSEYVNYDKKCNYYLAVFLDKGKIQIINNLEKPIVYDDQIVEPLGISSHNINFLSNYSRIYLSFSRFASNNFGSSFTSNDYNEYYLTPASITKEGSEYFEYLTSVIENNPFAKDLIQVFDRAFSFENILTSYAIVYGNLNDKVLTIEKEICFTFLNLLGGLVKSNNPKHKDLLDHINNNWPIKDRVITIENILFLVKVNFYVELISFGNFLFNSKGNNLDDDVIWKDAKEYVSSINDISEKEYFSKAIREIEFLEKLNLRFITNLLPPFDAAYSVKAVSSKKQIKQLFEIMFNKDAPSFLLKYLQFDFHYSDGEMVILTLYAYLFYVAHRSKFTNNKSSEIKQHVLLFLDELDISLHPKMKVHFIDDIIKFVKEQLSNHDVQIFLTSHSPIILSDIPSCNTIYLKRDGVNKTHVFSNVGETFGANISKLYSESFYFDDELPIGSFSKRYINDLFNTISKLDSKVDLNDSLKAQIELIGDILIKNQFYRKMQIKKTDVDNDQIKAIKEEMKKLFNMIEKIEGKDD